MTTKSKTGYPIIDDILESIAPLGESPASPAGERGCDEQDKPINVELIDGETGRCIGINDYRICGPKPIHGVVVSLWTTTKNDVLRAFLTPDEKHDWLAKGLQVVPAERYATLVEQREQLVDLLRYLKDTAFAVHVNDKHKPEAFAICEHMVCQRACQAWNEYLEKIAAATIEQETEVKSNTSGEVGR